MILRKLAAATIASSVLASGAWAQIATDTGNTEVSLTVAPTLALFVPAGLAFTPGTTGETIDLNYCVETNWSGNVALTAAVVGDDFELTGENTGTAFPYTIGGVSAASGINVNLTSTEYQSSCAGVETTGGQKFDVVIGDASGLAVDKYSQDVTFTVEAI